VPVYHCQHSWNREQWLPLHTTMSRISESL
jgi:hypothetical protein